MSSKVVRARSRFGAAVCPSAELRLFGRNLGSDRWMTRTPVLYARLLWLAWPLVHTHILTIRHGKEEQAWCNHGLCNLLPRPQGQGMHFRY